MQALLDFRSKVNAMNPVYAAKLVLITRKIDVSAQKIDGSVITYGMAIASFPLQDKLGKGRFLKKTFLLTDTSMKVVLGMLFLSFSNANIWFAEKELI